MPTLVPITRVGGPTAPRGNRGARPSVIDYPTSNIGGSKSSWLGWRNHRRGSGRLRACHKIFVSSAMPAVVFGNVEHDGDAIAGIVHFHFSGLDPFWIEVAPERNFPGDFDEFFLARETRRMISLRAVLGSFCHRATLPSFWIRNHCRSVTTRIV